MIKNLVLLLISISLFLLGVILKLIDFPGSAIFLLLGLAVFTGYTAIVYFRYKNPRILKVFLISTVILLTTLIFAMIKYPFLYEMVLGAVIAGVVIYFIGIFFSNKKNDNF